MIKYVIGVITLLLLVLAYMLLNAEVIGTGANRLEASVRKNHKIDERWQVSTSITDKVGAMLFYNEELTKHTYAIYTTKEGLSLGYFFHSGGILNDIEEGIKGYSNRDGMVLISMNKDQASLIEVTMDGISPSMLRYTLDPAKPFAIAISMQQEGGTLSIYDNDGIQLPINNIQVGGY